MSHYRETHKVIQWGIYCIYFVQTHYIEVGEDISFGVLFVDLVDIRRHRHQQLQMGDVRYRS